MSKSRQNETPPPDGVFYILDKDGKTPIQIKDALEWAHWHAEHRVIVVKREETTLRTTISTVFLSMDHSWGGGDPILWETMVFGGPYDGEQRRYTSWDDAVEGHNEMYLMVSRYENGWRYYVWVIKMLFDAPVRLLTRVGERVKGSEPPRVWQWIKRNW